MKQLWFVITRYHSLYSTLLQSLPINSALCPYFALFCRWCTSFNQKWVDLMAKTDSRCNGKISPHFLAYLLLIFRNTDQQGFAFKKSCRTMSLNCSWRRFILIAKTDSMCNGKISPHFLAYRISANSYCPWIIFSLECFPCSKPPNN